MAFERIALIPEGGVEQTITRVSPTIIIGLGGTGQQVLLKIRRLFAEKYGSIDSIPIVQYVYIDTDDADASQEDLTRTNDPFISVVDFKKRERAKISVSVPKYVKNINNYPNVKKWLKTTGNIAKLGEIIKGAEQIRSASRLAFFEHFGNIQDCLQNAFKAANSSENRAIMDTHNMDPNYQALNVYVIFSIAGGTGSGIFLDLGFLLREMFQAFNLSTIAFAVLPGIFANHGDRTLANGYAALKEADFYKFGNDFMPQWTASFEHKKYAPPPYNFFYLIDSQCEGGAQLTYNNRPFIYDMIAENIFQDFGNSVFADYRRSTRVNLSQYLNAIYGYKHLDADGETVLKEAFSLRYSAFGLSTIKLPATRIKNACAFKLASEIIAQWGVEWRENKYGEVDKEIVQNVFPKLNMLEGSRPTIVGGREEVSQLINRIDKYSAGVGFASKIATEVEQVRQLLINSTESDWRGTFLKRRADIEFNLRGTDSSEQENWGDWLNIVRKNADTIVGELEAELKNLMGDYASRPQFGVGFILTLATRIKKYLSGEGMEQNLDANRYIPRFKKEIAKLDSLIKDKEKELNDNVEELRNMELKGGSFRIGHFKPALRRGIDEVSESFSRLLMLKVDRLLRVNAIYICERLMDKIGTRQASETGAEEFSGLLQTYQTLFEAINSMHKYCNTMYEYFKKKIDTPLVRNIYEPDELDNLYYPRFMGKDEAYRANLDKHTTNVLAKLGIAQLDQLVSQINSEGVTKVGEKIISYTMKVFDDIEKINILMILKERFNYGRNFIQEAIQNSKPWLRQSSNVGKYELDRQQKRFYVGLPEMPGSPVPDEFMKIITDIDPNLDRKQLGQQSEIVFYTEMAGFPAFYMHGIDSLKEAYIHYMTEKEADLHTTKDEYKYRDIIFFQDEDRDRWLLSHKAFILGSILGVLDGTENANEESVCYSFTDESRVGNARPYDLGIESRAILYMFERMMKKPIYQSVLDEVEKKKERLDSLEKWASYSAVLRYYQGEIYPMEQIDVGGGAYISVLSLHGSVIAEENRAIEIALKDQKISNRDLNERAGKLLQQIKAGKLPPMVKRIADSNRLRLEI